VLRVLNTKTPCFIFTQTENRGYLISNMTVIRIQIKNSDADIYGWQASVVTLDGEK
jgi:hypothetical protein